MIKGLEFGRDIEVGAGFRSKSKKKPDHNVRLFLPGAIFRESKQTRVI